MNASPNNLQKCRVVVSIYESFTIGAVLECHRKNKGYLKIWYLYVLSTIQFLQVNTHVIKKFQQFWFWSLLFNPQYHSQIFIKQPWWFQNCSWLLYLIKNWPRYWGLKRSLPFKNCCKSYCCLFVYL